MFTTEVLNTCLEAKVDITFSFRYAGKLEIIIQSIDLDYVPVSTKQQLPWNGLTDQEIKEYINRMIENVNELK